MNQNRSLTIVGVFVSALAICVALLEQKPETKIKPQITAPLVATTKPRSVAPRKMEAKEPSNQFAVETRVSMADSPN